jgi:hypothetical protein
MVVLQSTGVVIADKTYLSHNCLPDWQIGVEKESVPGKTLELSKACRTKTSVGLNQSFR